jgi:hypothetical protein
MTTRLNNIRANIQKFKFAVAVGHGTHDASLPPVLIPPNMYVIFLTKAGYLGSGSDTITQEWKNVFGSQNKMRNFIKGTLPRNEIPALVTRLGVDWKKLIYGPNMLIANHVLQMYDSERPSFDSMSGLWLPSNPSHAMFHRRTMTLQQLVATTRFTTSGKVILFISGCRGDTAIAQQTFNAAWALNANGYHLFTGRQNYNIPLTNYLRAIQNAEQHASRYMTLKRIRQNTGRRVVRGAASGSNNNSNGPNLNALNANLRAARSGNRVNIGPYIRMINHIKSNTFGKRVIRGETKVLPIAAARSND